VVIFSVALIEGACITPAEFVPVGIAFTQVAAGREFSCGMDGDGVVYCWDAYPGVPVVVSGDVKFSSFSTRFRHTCGVGQDGKAYCWGDNTWAQLGQPSGPAVAAPAAVSGGLTFKTVSVGLAHTCGVTTGGAVFCWGANDRTQLGQDSVAETCGGVPCSSTPVAVRPDLQFTVVSAGDFHACAVTTDGTALCWGEGNTGQLGDGASVQSTPVVVTGGHTFALVSAGGTHTCALTTGHEAYCWGSNFDLQLGGLSDDGKCTDGVLRCTTVPFAVVGGHQFDSLVTSAGVPKEPGGPGLGGHSCGLTAGGQAFCWGLNEYGQLGGSGQTITYTPALARSDTLFTQIAAGQEYTCGLTPEGEIHCWAHLTPRAR
jgi:hypothetical protein